MKFVLGEEAKDWVGSGTGTLDFLRLKGRRSLLDEAEAFPLAIEG